MWNTVIWLNSWIDHLRCSQSWWACLFCVTFLSICYTASIGNCPLLTSLTLTNLLSLFVTVESRRRPLGPALLKASLMWTFPWLRESKEGLAAVARVTMALCLVTPGWINKIYLIDGNIMTTASDGAACVKKEMNIFCIELIKHWVVKCKHSNGTGQSNKCRTNIGYDCWLES